MSRRAAKNGTKLNKTRPGMTRDAAYSAFEIPWQDRLLEGLLKIKAAAFERLCQKILKDSGFIKVDVTGRSGDGGIDGIGVLRLKSSIVSRLLSMQAVERIGRRVGGPGISAGRWLAGLTRDWS